MGYLPLPRAILVFVVLLFLATFLIPYIVNRHKGRSKIEWDMEGPEREVNNWSDVYHNFKQYYGRQ